MDGVEVTHQALGERRLVEALEDEVAGHRVGADEAVLLAVLGDVGDAETVDRARVVVGDVATVQRDRPALGRAHPAERLDELALAVALDAGDADDLTGAHLQVEAGDGPVLAVVVDLEAGDVEHDVAGVGLALVDLQHDAAPDHQVGQPGAVGLRRRGGADELAAAQHGDGVADGDRLAQLVGDEDDRRTGLGQVAHDLEQLVGLARREHGRRLVEDQDVGLPVQRLEDLHALLRADGEVLDQRRGVDGEPVLAGELADPRRRRGDVEERPLVRLCPEHDVLGDGEHRHELEVLVDHARRRG